MVWTFPTVIDEVTPSLIKDIGANAKSVSEKLKALRVLIDPSPQTFILAGGIDLISEWLAASVAAGETGIILAILGCLEKLPMTTEILRETKIGKIVTEQLKMCTNQVAVERARKLINSWKALAVGSTSIVSGSVDAQVVPAAKATGIALPQVKEVSDSPPSPKRARVEEEVILVGSDDDEDEGKEGAVSALASLLDTLPDLDAIGEDMTIQDGSQKKKGIRWRPDSNLVQMVEFAITDTCLDLRRTIEETHGGTSSLHPHGAETMEEHGKFIESRRKERAMAGRGLAHSRNNYIDDEIEVSTYIAEYRFPPPVHVYDAQAIFVAKNLKSYEKQDLADLHAARKEVLYGDVIPESPSDPSTSSKFYTSMNTTATTVDVFPSGVREFLEEVSKTTVPAHVYMPGTPIAAKPGLVAPTPSLPRIDIVTFEDEFVKLDSKLQTAIMGSRDLLKLFTQEPILLREMTLDKINVVLANLKRAQQPPQGSAAPQPHQQHHYSGQPQQRQPMGNPPMMDDRRSWGVSTIKSSVRSGVMTQMSHPSGNYPQQQYRPPQEPHQEDYYRQGPPRQPHAYTGQPGYHQYQQRRGPPR